MSINYKPSGAEITFLYTTPKDEIPFNEEINRIYVAYRQCYSRDSMVPVTQTDVEQTNILEKFKTFCSESLFVADQYNDAPTVYLAGKSYNADNIDAYVEALCNEYGRDRFCVFLHKCRFIKNHMRHGSPFEHAGLTVQIKNASRSFSHQWVRSRIASHSQQSQRYVGEKQGDFTVILPNKIYNNAEAMKVVSDYLGQLPDVIQKLSDLGIKNEDIRCVFPNAMYTSLVSTMNFREWQHLFELRIDSHAQQEIREISYTIWRFLNEKIPFIWANVWDRKVIETKE